MSDKVTKIRINGVEKEIGGSGSEGSITGSYCFPMIKASRQVKGFSEATIDFEALLDYLEASGVAVDETNYFDFNESRVSLRVCTYASSSSVESAGVFSLIMTYSGVDDSIHIDFETQSSGTGPSVSVPKVDFFDAEQHSGSLRQIIMTFLAPSYLNASFTLPTYVNSLKQVVSNTIEIEYDAIDSLLCFDLKDVDGFLQDVLVEYNPGSGSDSDSI